MVGNGEHLGLVLSRFGIMQKDAAAAVGVDPAMITRWKNGTERLSADSPRMASLVDFLLSPSRPLTEGDLRWLRSRFAEEGLDAHISDVAGLRDALANYLANDGSCIGQDHKEQRQLLLQDQFALSGVRGFVELVRSELARIPAGKPLYLVTTAAGIEVEPSFVSVATAAVERGMRLRLLVGDEPHAQRQGETLATADDGDRITQAFLPLMTSAAVQVRYASSAAPLVATAFTTTFLVPGRLCLHASRPTGSAAPIICGIRDAAYLAETERSLSGAWAAAPSAFQDPHEVTPRVVSGTMTSFYRGTAGLLVASDGLNPLFMSASAFDGLLERRDVPETERSWRVEAHEHAQQRLEHQIACGVPYREMTTAADAETVRTQGAVQVYGTTLVDARTVDIPAALDILRGYLRFATLYPNFDLRFANPSKVLCDGLWMLSEAPDPMRPDTGGVLFSRWEEGGVRQLVSHHPRVRSAVRELYEDAWGRFRFRIWHEGRLVTSNDDADPSLTVRFIRDKMGELEEMLHQQQGISW